MANWIIAGAWIGIVITLFVLAVRFLIQARRMDPGSIAKHTHLVLFIMFTLLGFTKLFDILIVNLGAAPEPIPFLADMFGVLPEDKYLGLLVMSLYLIAFSLLLFVLEKHTLNTKYILTIIPLLVILTAWILTLSGYEVDVFLTGLYGDPGAWILLFFFIPRSFIPFAYLYLAIKTSGSYRKKALALFFGYGTIVTFFVRQQGFEFLAPGIIIVGLITIIWGHSET